ncbi:MULTISPECIES: bifunctional diguanylate cyclase/phosphodiesterase [unclassified Thioalkalivibrio]|uniref:putative bifunctional diguanylate cyclase/phosphodiesterase n=1 Tax=unclassified Thioalkalivibrio TaxID=2621013 RepID=UPI000365CCC6|nr:MULTISPECIES: bifunctional diguanylate cyclase/phosphodiesterase [unclassified Thioalkalivibrio]
MISGRTPSITHYALLLAAIALVTLASFGLYTWYKVDQLRGEIQESGREAARQELAGTLEHVLTQAAEQASRFARWEEVRQQLGTPHYYAYWKNHRMHQAGILTDRILDAGIYDHQGMTLPGSDSDHLPGKLELPPPAPRAVRGDTEPFLMVIEPIPAPDAAQSPPGFVGLKSRFLDALREGRVYRHVDPESIRFDLGERNAIPARELLQHAQFDLRPNPMADQVEDLLSGAVVNLGAILGVITLVLFSTLAYLIVRPLRDISGHVDRLRESAGGLVLERVGGLLPVAETEKIRESLNSYQARLQDVHSSLEEKNREFWRIAHHDALTGVRNRRAFDEYWDTLPRLAARHSYPVCFALFDINHFKAINDSYGHQTGDAVLQSVARSIDEVLREGEHLFRIGGDEFAAILLNCDESGAQRLGERCQERIRATDFTQHGVREPIKISIGLAVAPGNNGPAMLALQWQADVAMYKAKRPGSSPVVLFTPELEKDTQSLYSNWINNAVYEAITRGTGIRMAYQPVVALNEHHPSYVEALLRIEHQGEVIGPADIFPVVEARRLEIDLDRAVLTRILGDLRASLIPPEVGISINLSGPTIVNAGVTQWLEAFVPFLQDRSIILEVTETALITEIGLATENLQRLRRKGFLVALDDFGSGYSSIRYLASMPVDTVKFDITLIRSLDIPDQHHILEGLARMIRDVGYTTVAEGIETAEQLSRVRALKFDFAQGYYLGHPTPVSQGLQPVLQAHAGISRM